MEIKFTTLHHIDLDKQNIIFKKIDKEDAKEYVIETIKKILSEEDSRLFLPKSDTVEVNAAINQIAADIENENIESLDIKNITDTVANRLLRVETETNENIKKLGTKIKKGSLIQSFLYNQDEEEYIYLIAKVEHSAFIDEKDLIKRIGLPYEKVVLKTCLMQFSSDFEINSIKIGDTNSTLSKYWWNDFLELREVNSNDYNTTMAFDKIDQCISKNVKRQSPYDYMTLRNSTIGYFRGHESFSFDDYYKNVFENYEPESKKLDIGMMKEKIKKLPEKNKFDRKFEIVQKQIKARIRKVYTVNDKIQLRLLDHISNIHNVIKSYIDEEGEKCLKIKIGSENEDVYKTFHHDE